MISDGLNEVIFHLLWAKDTLLGTDPKIALPDTIIYKFYQPRFWYFTSQDGTIKRKTKDKLTQENIKQEFLKKRSRSGIVAVFIYLQGSKKTIEFLTTETFETFMDSRELVMHGFLQKFVEPMGNQNSCITASWSPNFCLLEKLVNKINLYDKRYELYERAVTFEGKEYHYDSCPVRGIEISSKCYEAANSIANHISAVTFEKFKVQRMTLQFRLDKDLRVWFLCATALKFAKSDSLPLDGQSNIALPDNLNTRKITLDSRRPAILQKTVKCAFCQEEFESDKVTAIPYRMLVHNSPEVPQAIANIHKGLRLTEYLRVKSKEKFLRKEAPACFDCYFSFIKRKKSSGGFVTKVNSQSSLLGTGPLNPIKTRIRRENTHVAKPSPVSQGTSRAVFFSYRPSKTAGGELLLSPISLHSRSNK